MNFLAHAWLAGDAPADRLGGLIGDFVKGTLPAGLPAELAEGVRLHRRLDSFADTHPAFLRSRERISPARRRVAGVMVDMFYDHFLAARWGDFDTRPLLDFTRGAYRLMADHESILPPRLRALLPRMQADDWLASYRSVDALAYALDRMALRLTRSVSLPHVRPSGLRLADDDRREADHHGRVVGVEHARWRRIVRRRGVVVVVHHATRLRRDIVRIARPATIVAGMMAPVVVRPPAAVVVVATPPVTVTIALAGRAVAAIMIARTPTVSEAGQRSGEKRATEKQRHEELSEVVCFHGSLPIVRHRGGLPRSYDRRL